MYNGQLPCGFNVPIKGLNERLELHSCLLSDAERDLLAIAKFLVVSVLNFSMTCACS